jgi:chloride channel protein, CIC family
MEFSASMKSSRNCARRCAGDEASIHLRQLKERFDVLTGAASTSQRVVSRTSVRGRSHVRFVTETPRVASWTPRIASGMKSRFRFLLALLVVALASAVFAVTFRFGLSWWYHAVFNQDNVVRSIAGLPWWLRLAVPAAGAFVAGVIARWRKAPSQGVSNVMEAVVLGRVQLSLRTTMSRISSSAVAIASGMSIGREGPLIEFGGSMGAAGGRLMRTSLDETRVLVAAGTAAGFAAAYNTPFAAILFVFETIIGIATPAALLPTMTATVIATVVTRALAGAGPIYGQRLFEAETAHDLWWLLALGALGAMVATAFKWALSQTEEVMERLFALQPWRAIAGGLIVGTLAVGLPEVAGNGYEPLNELLDHRMAAMALGVLLLAKIVATSASVASGVPGGIFTPMLLVGAVCGSLWAQFVAVLVPSASPDIGAYALVGMAATTAASIHAPLTAAVMVFELSGDYAIVVPLILATTVSTALSRMMGSESVYEAELRRRGLGWDLTLEGRELDRNHALRERVGTRGARDEEPSA